MNNPRITFMMIALTLMSCARKLEFEVPDTTGMKWLKGNTHAHTTMSDGDSPPEVVARWYKDHCYHFLVLSDHNVFTDPNTLSSLVDSNFILIAGEEVTSSFQEKPVHVNGLNIPHVVNPEVDTSLVGTIQKNVDAVRAVNGVPHINHPNFRWAFSHRELLQINNDKLLEIFNGHPLVHNFGSGSWPSAEQMWDLLLTAGKRIYGIAVDDAHEFKEFSAMCSNPGRGWVVVRARTLDALEIVQNLEKGLFYASTGVELDDVRITPTKIEIHIKQQEDFKHLTEFIGGQGRILLQTESNPAVYELSKEEKYVRAKVYDSGGSFAWIQPVFVRRR